MITITEFCKNHKPELYFAIGVLTGIALVIVIQSTQPASISCFDACSSCTLCEALVP